MDSMQHFFWKINSRGKAELASYIAEKCGRSIIFCRTRAGVNRLGDEMSEMDLSFTTLHGGMKQKQRDRSMHKFSAGQARVMIATDVASRGIDVDDVNCVIHFDPPDDGKAYKHRSGRTARAGSTGTVVTWSEVPEQAVQASGEEVGIRCRRSRSRGPRGGVRKAPSRRRVRQDQEGPEQQEGPRRSRRAHLQVSQGSNRRNGGKGGGRGTANPRRSQEAPRN